MVVSEYQSEIIDLICKALKTYTYEDVMKVMETNKHRVTKSQMIRHLRGMQHSQVKKQGTNNVPTLYNYMVE